MNHSMFAALLFAMLSGMHNEEPAPDDSQPQNTRQITETESEQAEPSPL